jgi:hypothetical protein
VRFDGDLIKSALVDRGIHRDLINEVFIGRAGAWAEFTKVDEIEKIAEEYEKRVGYITVADYHKVKEIGLIKVMACGFPKTLGEKREDFRLEIAARRLAKEGLTGEEIAIVEKELTTQPF